MAELAQGKQYVLITSYGTDRPGIVEELSGWILGANGNIEDSRMTRLGGEFATLILVTGSNSLLETFEQSRDDFEKANNLTITCKIVSPNPPTPDVPVLRYTLQATALDHAGIIHGVAQLLRKESISIATASTHTTPAPFTGTPVFHFEMVIDIPTTISIHQLRSDLQKLGDSEQIDFDLRAIGEG